MSTIEERLDKIEAILSQLFVEESEDYDYSNFSNDKCEKFKKSFNDYKERKSYQKRKSFVDYRFERLWDEILETFDWENVYEQNENMEGRQQYDSIEDMIDFVRQLTYDNYINSINSENGYSITEDEGFHVESFIGEDGKYELNVIYIFDSSYVHEDDIKW